MILISTTVPEPHGQYLNILSLKPSQNHIFVKVKSNQVSFLNLFSRSAVMQSKSKPPECPEVKCFRQNAIFQGKNLKNLKNVKIKAVSAVCCKKYCAILQKILANFVL